MEGRVVSEKDTMRWSYDLACKINNAFELGLSDQEMNRAASIISRALVRRERHVVVTLKGDQEAA